MNVPMMMSWVFVPSLFMIFQRAAEKLACFLFGKFGYDMLKSYWEMGLLPVWRLHRQIWLAVTAKMFWIWKRCLMHLFNLVWRSYRASFMKIVRNLWPVDMYYWFWQLSTWRLNSDVSMRNNLLATWIGLTVSPDNDNKFETYSCEERGVKTHHN
jgi:hypothetical protein